MYRNYAVSLDVILDLSTCRCRAKLVSLRFVFIPIDNDLICSYVASMRCILALAQGEATVWLSSSFLSCKVSAGAFASRGQIVTSGIGVGTTTQTFTIDAAKQFAVAKKNGANTGSLVISVSGSNLGTASYSISERVGDSAAENSRWLSFTSLLCRVIPYISRLSTFLVVVFFAIE
jgi:hypothetical protein